MDCRRGEREEGGRMRGKGVVLRPGPLPTQQKLLGYFQSGKIAQNSTQSTDATRRLNHSFFK